jgi:hypothetical protein
VPWICWSLPMPLSLIPRKQKNVCVHFSGVTNVGRNLLAMWHMRIIWSTTCLSTNVHSFVNTVLEDFQAMQNLSITRGFIFQMREDWHLSVIHVERSKFPLCGIWFCMSLTFVFTYLRYRCIVGRLITLEVSYCVAMLFFLVVKPCRLLGRYQYFGDT